MTSKQLNIVLGVVIVALIGVVAYLGAKQNNKPTTFDECVTAGGAILESYPRQCQYKGLSFTEKASAPLTAPPPTPSTTNKPSPTPSPNDAANWKVYKNTTYGFQITLTDAWKGYKTVPAPIGSNFGIGGVAFCLPTSDKAYTPNYCDKGYGDAMIIYVYSKEQWAMAQKGIINLLGQNKAHTFGWSMWQREPLDYQNTNLGFGAIVDSFKTL